LRKPSYSSELSFAGEIAEQAGAYVRAIDFSMAAARNGFTIAEEAKTLGEFIPHSLPEDREDYLVQMLALAQHGHNNANKAYEAFRGVRQNIIPVRPFFVCGLLVLTYSVQLLKKVQPQHESVTLKFPLYVNGNSMSIPLF
jgi:hypothetical protein